MCGCYTWVYQHDIVCKMGQLKNSNEAAGMKSIFLMIALWSGSVCFAKFAFAFSCQLQVWAYNRALQSLSLQHLKGAAAQLKLKIRPTYNVSEDSQCCKKCKTPIYYSGIFFKAHFTSAFSLLPRRPGLLHAWRRHQQAPPCCPWPGWTFLNLYLFFAPSCPWPGWTFHFLRIFMCIWLDRDRTMTRHSYFSVNSAISPIMPWQTKLKAFRSLVWLLMTQICLAAQRQSQKKYWPWLNEFQFQCFNCQEFSVTLADVAPYKQLRRISSGHSENTDSELWVSKIFQRINIWYPNILISVVISKYSDISSSHSKNTDYKLWASKTFQRINIPNSPNPDIMISHSQYQSPAFQNPNILISAPVTARITTQSWTILYKMMQKISDRKNVVMIVNFVSDGKCSFYHSLFLFFVWYDT